MRAFLEQEYTAPPAPKFLNRNVFLLDELSYQDVQQQLTLLMIAYAKGLQYWAEKLNLPRSPDLCPLAGSVVELIETVQEYVTTLFSCMLSLSVKGQDLMEATTHTTSPIAEEDLTRCTAPHLKQKERAVICWSLLPPWGSLTWGPVVITTKDPQMIHMMTTFSRTHRWLPHSLDVPGPLVFEVSL